MKTLLLIVSLLIVVIAFVVLQGRVSSIASSGAEISGIDWRPVSVRGVELPEDSGMRIRFEIDGSISGHAGCNSFFGSLQQTESGVEVGPLGATRMACPDAIMKLETAFLQAVQETKSFATDKTGMSLLGEDGTILATFTDAPGD